MPARPVVQTCILMTTSQFFLPARSLAVATASSTVEAARSHGILNPLAAGIACLDILEVVPWLNAISMIQTKFQSCLIVSEENSTQLCAVETASRLPRLHFAVVTGDHLRRVFVVDQSVQNSKTEPFQSFLAHGPNRSQHLNFLIRERRKNSYLLVIDRQKIMWLDLILEDPHNHHLVRQIII